MTGPAEPTPSTGSKPPPRRARRVVGWIMLAVVLWGVLLATGTYLYRYETVPDSRAGQRAVRRTLVVLGCTGGFLGLWGAALAWRAAGNSRRGRDSG